MCSQNLRGFGQLAHPPFKARGVRVFVGRHQQAAACKNIAVVRVAEKAGILLVDGVRYANRRHDALT